MISQAAETVIKRETEAKNKISIAIAQGENMLRKSEEKSLNEAEVMLIKAQERCEKIIRDANERAKEIALSENEKNKAVLEEIELISKKRENETVEKIIEILFGG